MKTHKKCLHVFIIAVIVSLYSPDVFAEILYVDSLNGNDEFAGTKEKPLRTIQSAVRMVNDCTKDGPTTIKIHPGLYVLDQSVIFHNKRKYTKDNRLTIEATILPNDPTWNPASMPVIISMENPRKDKAFQKLTETYSFKIKISHVTIRGLKFLGNPILNNWHCCVERIGQRLSDLRLTQCVFVGDKDTSNIYCAALATGDRFIVENCIFKNCHASVLLWDGPEGIPAKNCAMKYCIVRGGYISGVWTCRTAEDFEFHHNIITG